MYEGCEYGSTSHLKWKGKKLVWNFEWYSIPVGVPVAGFISPNVQFSYKTLKLFIYYRRHWSMFRIIYNSSLVQHSSVVTFNWFGTDLIIIIVIRNTVQQNVNFRKIHEGLYLHSYISCQVDLAGFISEVRFCLSPFSFRKMRHFT